MIAKNYQTYEEAKEAAITLSKDEPLAFFIKFNPYQYGWVLTNFSDEGLDYSYAMLGEWIEDC